MKIVLRIPAVLLLATLAASAATLNIQPSRSLPEFRNSIIWDAKTLSTGRDANGTFLIADLNEDQRLDAVILDYAIGEESSTGIGVYLQNADGSFSRKGSYPPIGICLAILRGDFNEDGHTDLLLEESGNDLWLMLGHGDGTFGDPQLLGFSAPISPVLADLNGDQHLDIVAGSASDGTVTVLLGNGKGGFKEARVAASALLPQQSPAPGAGQIMLGDMNHDGKLDLVVASPQQSGPSWTGNLDVCFGNGDGTFRDPITTPDVAAWRGALGDFNGDGVLDFVGDHYSPRQLEIWLGQTNGQFVKRGTVATPYAPIVIQAVDINEDQILDLIVTGETSIGSAPVSIFLGKGDGTFQASRALNVPARTVVVWYGLQIVDFNGDRRPDLVLSLNGPNAADKSGGLAVAMNPGTLPAASGGFLLQVQNPPTFGVTVEWSTDFQLWKPLATNATPVGAWSLLDSTGSNQARRFYRTRQSGL